MTALRTQTIRYNLKDRQRTHSGNPRNFDVPAIVAAINSPKTQERVKKRDMLGYYGHWPRQRLGLIPPEGAVIDGAVVQIEPAFVTVSLKASLDGTIEHVAEFFDNPPGQVASRLWKNKAGGFSSAIHEPSETFYGFDYVMEPNYSGNRPYVMDSARPASPLTLDEVNHYLNGELAEGATLAAILDSTGAEQQALRDQLKGKDKEIAALRETIRVAKMTFDAGTFGKPGKTARLFDKAKELPGLVRNKAREKKDSDKPTGATFDDVKDYLGRFRG